MLSFNIFFTEAWGNDEKGKFHELLTGYYLNKSKHIKDPKGRPGESAKDAHARYTKMAKLHGGQKLIDASHAKAKAAAADLKRQIETGGHKIKHVHWSSKDGDVERVTGVKVEKQKDDASDIIVTTHKNGKETHHGISLKVSDNTLKVPASSLGKQSSGRKTIPLSQKHKDRVLAAYPELKNQSNKRKRKEWAKANPKAQANKRQMNKDALADTAKKHAREINARMRLGRKNPQHIEHVISHLRDVMGAKAAPMQKAGHNYLKHTTYQSKTGKMQTATSNPGKDYEHHFDNIRKNPHKFKAVHTSGGTVNYQYDGKTFASQAHKFDSQSDPLSTMKSAGRIT